MLEIKETEVEEVVKVKKKEYVLTLTKEELETIGLLCGTVIGNHPRRKFTDKLWDKIYVEIPSLIHGGDCFKSTLGTLSFKDAT